MIDKTLYEQKQEHQGKSTGLLIGDSWRMWGRLAMITKLLESHDLHKGSVLDLGCGYADLHRMIPEAQYTGVETTAWIAAHAQKSAPQGSIIMADVKDDSNRIVPVSKRNCVVAAGLLATVPPIDLPDFMTALVKWAPKYLLLTWLDASQYRGKLYAHSMYNLSSYLEAFKIVDWLDTLKGDEIQVGKLFVRR